MSLNYPFWSFFLRQNPAKVAEAILILNTALPSLKTSKNGNLYVSVID